MIYIDNPKIPTSYRVDYGLKLCKLWFAAKFGATIDKEYLENFTGEKLIINEVSPYKIAYPLGEILFINGNYFVGDGYGNPIYSPTRASMEELTSGNFQIERKFTVEEAK